MNLSQAMFNRLVTDQKSQNAVRVTRRGVNYGVSKATIRLK